ncbi:MAG: toprim domain-containing protein [Devosia sp.]|nr:toprim domain-containing protein [Devosia sp.]
MTDDDSSFIGKEPCPECGSRDNLARYSDGHGYCFGCGYRERGDGSGANPITTKRTSMEDAIDGEFKPLAKRAISEETCRKFGYTVGTKRDGTTVQIAPYYDADGNVVAQKTRDADKNFSVIGSLKTALLFGQNLWPSGGRRVTVIEGEIDTMSVSQVQGNKWPVVGIPNGAQGAKKALARQLEWLNTFEEIVLMFDMDEPGQEAARECAPLFPAGKAKIASLPRKDPNEMLVAGEGDLIVRAIWDAKVYRPDGIVTLADIKADILKPVELGLPWWSETLTKLTYGRRHGELYAVGAGTGIGKSDWLSQQVIYDLTELDQKVGVFFLEQQPRETGQRLAGKLAGKRFHVPDGSWTSEELANKSEGVRIFYLDHLTALAATAEDERKALEVIMAELGGLVKELDIILTIVSHLATPEGKPHEEGGRVMIRHFKGSRAIGFWCAFMFGLERDQQAEDPMVASTTTFRVLKDRYMGQATGEVIYLGYDPDTGRLFETTKPAEPGNAHGFVPEDDAPF